MNLNILARGHSLSKIGIEDYAYSQKDIGDVLVELERLQVTILGGDVYRFGDDGLVKTYDSWYYAPLGNQSDMAQSLHRASGYITNYITRNGEDYYFSFLFKSV